MFMTLPEEVRPVADKMVDDVISICKRISDYKPLYNFYSETEGGKDYYRAVCREFWREWGSKVAAS